MLQSIRQDVSVTGQKERRTPRLSPSLNLAARAYLWVASGDAEFLSSFRRSAPHEADMAIADAVAAQLMLRALCPATVLGCGLILASSSFGAGSIAFGTMRALAYFLVAFPIIVMACVWVYAFSRPRRRRDAVLLVRAVDAYSFRPFRVISATGCVGATVFGVITAALELRF